MTKRIEHKQRLHSHAFQPSRGYLTLTSCVQCGLPESLHGFLIEHNDKLHGPFATKQAANAQRFYGDFA